MEQEFQYNLQLKQAKQMLQVIEKLTVKIEKIQES